MALNGVSEPNSRYPSAANADNSITQNGFTVTTRKLPILKAEPIEQMTKNLAIAPPEMIFGDNLVSIQHTSGWGINFNTYDALDRVDKTGGSMLQVAHSKEWQSTREKKHEGITEVVKPFDWSYSTDYKGTTQSETPAFEASTKPIPLELLKRPDPILFFDEVLLYEDEMADNGITMFSCKVRVMPQRLLLLCRFFMRLDGVLLRIRDTRVYVDFGTQEVIREYLAKEEKYETVREKLSARGQDAPAQLRDPNNLTDLLPVVEKSLESLVLSKPPNPHKQFSTNHRLAAAQAKQQPKITITPSPLPNAPSKSSSAAPLQDTPPSQSATSTKKGLGQKIRDTLPSSVTETYIAYGACEKLIKECARQADYTIPQAREKDVEIPRTKDGEDLGVGTGWWFETLNLTPTFMTWAQITFLHMYLLTVRLRMFPPAHAPTWHQHLLDHFFYTAEERMVTTHNMAARSIRNKYLKDLFVQWRGLLAAYDEGLVRGDAVLATAVWRNVFKAGGLKKGDAGGAGGNVVDWRGLGDVVSYMRGVLKGLEGIGDEKIATGEVEFGDPGTERKGVLVRSRLMDAPGQLAGGTEKAGGRVKTVSDPSDIV